MVADWTLLHVDKTQNIPGILWLLGDPPLHTAPLISFSLSEIEHKLKGSEKIFHCLQSNYFPRSKDIFTPGVVSHWQSWFEHQKNIWCVENFVRQYSEMAFLRDLTSRKASMTEDTTGSIDINNPEPGDPEEDRPYVTFDSGIHGKFTAQERQTLVRDLLLEEESTSTSPILTKMGCIYKYEYQGRSNIMVGMVKKVNYNEDNTISSVEVLQCPPRGAKKDNLYIDFSADTSFNLDYRIRVTDVLEREMLLAYNLVMTDSGCFSKKRKSGKHGHSSYTVAKTSIDSFYQRRVVANSVVL